MVGLTVAGAVVLVAGCKEGGAPKDDTRDLLKSEKAGGGRTLTPQERGTLLRLARKTLVASVTGVYPRAMTDGFSVSPRLEKRQGAFVTYKIKGRLRGCIGTILPRHPLYQAVIRNAKNAALHDRRFKPVSMGEIPQIEIEISALSVPRSVKSFEEIVVGKHGIILMGAGGRSATYLPHVATEQKWDRDTTLNHLSRKAGLSTAAWREAGTTFQVYTAEVWAEHDLRRKH